MVKYTYSKKVSPLDIYELFKAKGVNPSDVTIEEDGDEVRVVIANFTPDSSDEAKLDDLMKVIKRKK
jgi:hypothetical protein